MTVSAVVFDLDETLAIPRRERQTLMTDAMASIDAPAPTREEYLEAHSQHLTGETRAPIFTDIFETYDTDVDPADAATAYRGEIAAALKPVEDAESLLAELRGRYRVGLLTNGPVVAQRDKIETLGWETLFDEAIVTGELSAGKPDSRAFEAILAALDVPAAETVYVGDQVRTDIHGAKDAGLQAIQVLYDGGPGPDERADTHVDRAAMATELPDALGTM
ncbi:HAD family hydrolase [Natranaeroarchaeum sulfidigenes]|uniref:HAD superfamily hydrolase n=1 Tax=Natranaeroarchaeum sulfidigenes TaxID=2784880 RepID=A0A897MZS4_9EURY|nr:HAD family hydrolase [Natranaeroarchaeum sulfidigenes]QSG03885.1 HAD superfamily hydrolase [Natranaeroarchaeum sulfidigenes]